MVSKLCTVAILLLFLYSALDIKELKIVKSAAEASKVLPKNATPSKLSKETAEDLDHVASPGLVVEPKTDIANSKNYSNGQKNNGQTRDRYSDVRYYECSAQTKDRLGYDETLKSNSCRSPHRYTPTWDTNGTGHRHNMNRYVTLLNLNLGLSHYQKTTFWTGPN